MNEKKKNNTKNNTIGVSFLSIFFEQKFEIRNLWMQICVRMCVCVCLNETKCATNPHHFYPLSIFFLLLLLFAIAGHLEQKCAASIIVNRRELEKQSMRWVEYFGFKMVRIRIYRMTNWWQCLKLFFVQDNQCWLFNHFHYPTRSWAEELSFK